MRGGYRRLPHCEFICDHVVLLFLSAFGCVRGGYRRLPHREFICDHVVLFFISIRLRAGRVQASSSLWIHLWSCCVVFYQHSVACGAGTGFFIVNSSVIMFCCFYQHSVACGAGTGVFLIVNSSVIMLCCFLSAFSCVRGGYRHLPHREFICDNIFFYQHSVAWGAGTGVFLIVNSSVIMLCCCFYQHSVACGAGTGVFLIVNSSVIIVVRGSRAAIWGSVYLDQHGEEDRDLKWVIPTARQVKRSNCLQNADPRIRFIVNCYLNVYNWYIKDM